MHPDTGRRPARLIAFSALLVMVAGLLALVPSLSASAHTEDKNIALTNTTTQMGRIFRDGTPTACGTAEAYPGLTLAATVYNYTTSTYVAPASGCLTLTRVSADCGDATTNSVNAHVILYHGTYDPLNQGTNYVGDQGSSANASTFGVDVVAGQTYTVVVSNTASQANCAVVVRLQQLPDTKITSGPSGPRDTPTFAFSGSDAGTFQCSIDSGAFAPCTSPKALSGLSVGAHTFAVKAVDADTTVDPSPATQAFTKCDRASAIKALTKAKKSVKKAKAALKAAKKSGNAVAIAKATKKLKKAKKKLKKAKAALAACPA